ncbi:MAG: exosortase system-associated protein, TIGR04073 family [Verrucomicrobia bacterium]|nr:exosortase system-associated protein, TIGR04073 family [Verrucomicrobiota bacterium]
MKIQTRKLIGVVVAAAALVCFSSPNASAETMWDKLKRGFVNTVSGCVEIPGCIYDVCNREGGLVGSTWGTVKGVGLAPVRTMVGIFEIITFPIPTNDYQPVMNPTTPYDYFSEEDKPKAAKPSASYVPPTTQAGAPMLTMGPGPLDYAPILRR